MGSDANSRFEIIADPKGSAVWFLDKERKVQMNMGADQDGSGIDIYEKEEKGKLSLGNDKGGANTIEIHGKNDEVLLKLPKPN
jgi:hypothetical protein